MTTAAILKELIALPESPWADIKGKPLNDLGLARRLRHYAIKPKLIREGDLVSRGYERGDFIDAWGRYLDVTTVTTVTGVTGSERHEGR